MQLRLNPRTLPEATSREPVYPSYHCGSQGTTCLTRHTLGTRRKRIVGNSVRLPRGFFARVSNESHLTQGRQTTRSLTPRDLKSREVAKDPRKQLDKLVFESLSPFESDRPLASFLLAPLREIPFGHRRAGGASQGRGAYEHSASRSARVGAPVLRGPRAKMRERLGTWPGRSNQAVRSRSGRAAGIAAFPPGRAPTAKCSR